MLDKSNPPLKESKEQLIQFWNAKISPNLNKFVSNPNLISIIEELNLTIEKYQFDSKENTFSNCKQYHHHMIKSFSTALFPNQSNLNGSNMFNGVSLIKNTFNNNILTSSGLFIDSRNDKEVIDFYSITNEDNEKDNDSVMINKNGNSSKGDEVVFEPHSFNIKWITIDFLVKASIKEKFIKKYKDLVNAICQQHSIFISTDLFIEKITFAFNDYYSQYSTNANDNNINNNNNVTISYDIILLLNSFITQCHYLIKSNCHTLTKTTEFIKSIIQIPDINIKSEKLILSMQKLLIIPQQSLINKTKSLALQSSYNKKGKIQPLNLFAYTPQGIAQELTRISLTLFNRIEANEFFNAKFIKKDKAKLSPNILNLIERFNSFSLFIIEEILSYDFPKVRAKLITHWINIADELRKINNLNDCFNVTAALNHMILKKLKTTWKQVSTKTLTMFSGLQKLISFENNYHLFRSAMVSAIEKRQMVIPYLGFYTQTICYIDEMSQFIIDDNMINCDKVLKVYHCLNEFFYFKQFKNNYSKTEGLEILQCLNPLKENELENEALMIEPIFILYSKKSNNKRSTHTDHVYFKANSENDF